MRSTILCHQAVNSSALTDKRSGWLSIYVLRAALSGCYYELIRTVHRRDCWVTRGPDYGRRFRTVLSRRQSAEASWQRLPCTTAPERRGEYGARYVPKQLTARADCRRGSAWIH